MPPLQYSRPGSFGRVSKMEAGPDQDHETTQRAAHALPSRTREDLGRTIYRRGIHATLDDRPQILLLHRSVGCIRTGLRHGPGPLAWVASDLNPGSEDYEQILKTPRLIIHTDQMTIDRAKPESLEALPENPSSAGQQGTRSS